MTTPNDTTDRTDDATNRSTDHEKIDRETTRREPTRAADDSPRPIPGRIPVTEEAGAPLVPRTTTEPTKTATAPATTTGTGTTETGTTGTETTGTSTATATTEPATNRGGVHRRPSRPPTDADRDAPLVPDLRPARRPRTDGGLQ
ncbi:hypothetical protein [Halorubrum trueperi]|uniref:Uncharacterized protein n=1 Tax=Halorubrum trueperi TaxID=2004704 RepID=A0ABD5UME3_9EURY